MELTAHYGLVHGIPVLVTELAVQQKISRRPVFEVDDTSNVPPWCRRSTACQQTDITVANVRLSMILFLSPATVCKIVMSAI